MSVKIVVVIIIGFIAPINLFSQVNYRIESDFTIKEKSSAGYENLMMGRVYYDKNQRQIVFNVLFPEKEVLIINDTASITAIAGKYKKHELGSFLIDFSVLNLFLNGELSYFGLNKTPFKLENVEKDNGLVISTWILGDKYTSSPVSKMMLSQKDNNLYGLITFGPNNVILSKQLFSDYFIVGGMDFPGKVIQISYLPNGGNITKITTYRNVVINSTENDSYYKYRYLHN